MTITSSQIRENLLMGLNTMRTHKFRSFLTILGVVIGVTSVTAVASIIQGLNNVIADRVELLGSKVFFVSRMTFQFGRIPEKIRKRKFLEYEDAVAIRENCPHVELATAFLTRAAMMGKSSTIKYRNESLNNPIIRGAEANYDEILPAFGVKEGRSSQKGRRQFNVWTVLTDVQIRGVTASHIFNTSSQIEDGRYISLFDERQSTPVCVIGDDIAEQLFPGLDPIGKLLRVDDRECRIIGRMERVGSVLGQSQDTFVLLPISTFLKAYGYRRSVTLLVQSPDAASFGLAQDEVRMLLRVRRHRSYRQADDFYIATSETFLALWESISSAFFIAFIFIASIASIVGGIVIMNIMLVSVTERTREIGIRRALGARRADIRRQLLVETLIQCLLGGFLGVSFGFIVAIVVAM